MSPHARPGPPGPPAATALVLTPGPSHPADLTARRLAEALGELGVRASACDLREAESRRGPADFCLMVGLGAMLDRLGDRREGVRRLRALGPFGGSAVVTSGPVQGDRFADAVAAGERVGADVILDLGLIDQSPRLDPGLRDRYRFVPDGLTGAERSALEALPEEGGDRPIPWSFVGRLTPERAGFVDYLVRTLDPRGFVSVPSPEPDAGPGTPYLDAERYRAVLSKSSYHLWCSPADPFHLEADRFRQALLSGCVPLRVLDDGEVAPAGVPLRPFLLTRSELAGALRPGRERWFLRLLADFYRPRSLAEALGRALDGLGGRRIDPAARAWPRSA